MKINEAQKVVDEWVLSHGGYWNSLAIFTRLTEEVGELGREVRMKEGFHHRPKPHRVEEEMADVLFTLFVLANQTNVDLTKHLKKVMEKYCQRDFNE